MRLPLVFVEFVVVLPVDRRPPRRRSSPATVMRGAVEFGVPPCRRETPARGCTRWRLPRSRWRSTSTHDAGVGLLAQELVDLPLGADVDAGGGLFQHRAAALQVEPARQHHLLLVAAAEVLHLGVRRGRVDVELPDQRAAPRSVRRCGASRVIRRAERQRGIGEQVLLHAERCRRGSPPGGRPATADAGRIACAGLRGATAWPASSDAAALQLRTARTAARPIASCPAPRSPTRPSTSPRRTVSVTGPALPSTRASSASTVSVPCAAGLGQRHVERAADDQLAPARAALACAVMRARPTSLPSRMTAARSEMSSTSSSRCET